MLTLNVAELCPDGIITLLGVTVATVELLTRVTVVPAGGATLLSVTVPETVPPPMTEAADSVTPLTEASLILPSRCACLSAGSWPTSSQIR